MRTATLPVTITVYVDEHQHGWVEGYVTDADGHQWAFYPVKQVYVSRPHLDANTAYPVVGETGCRVVEERDGVATVALLDVSLVARDEDYPRLRVIASVLTWDATET